MKNKSSNNCRICYNYYFKASNKEIPCFEGKPIEGLSLWFEHSFFKKDYGIYNEVFFPKDGTIQPHPVYDCIYGFHQGYKMGLDKTKFFTQTKYDKVTFIPAQCDIWIKGESSPQVISFTEGVEILTNYPHVFNLPDNFPTKIIGFCFKEIPAANET